MNVQTSVNESAFTEKIYFKENGLYIEDSNGSY